MMTVKKTAENDTQQNKTLDRATLCMSSSTPGLTLHGGDVGFSQLVNRHYTVREAQANEAICRLKSRLPSLSTDDYWKEMMEGITEITGSQYAIAVRRILPDDQDAPVEMPELGDPGQCLMATAFFYNDGKVHRDHVRDYKYYPYSGPCSHMKHDKVFVVPSDLANFIGDQIHRRFAFPVEAYIGIPLFSPSGECIGHFGALWSEKGMRDRKLDWGFIEMTLHALEDTVSKKLLSGQAFSKRPEDLTPQVIPSAVVNVAQSLKPYARSLSHELRTPMQGVVGMLEIMHATVTEALENPLEPEIAKTFRMLRENIEVVQDSSRRAVEAADNVVHAADLDMQVPETPDHSEGSRSDSKGAADYFVGEQQASQSPYVRKRKREDHVAPPAKFVAVETPDMPPRPLTPRTAAIRSAVRETGHIAGMDRPLLSRHAQSEVELAHSPIVPATKITRVREHLRTIVNECLRYGGRPESAIAKDTLQGEIIEARSRDGKGQISKQRIEWTVHPHVPDEIHVDERDFTKLVSVLLLNALKFTRSGRIWLSASLENSSRLLVVNVVDTGTGIPAEFIPNLFKAFSRQDDTITRQSEGLGLGLLVAKGVARKIGGDIRCVRSDTQGPKQGSEFEFKVPVSPSEASSRQSSPGQTLMPADITNKMAGAEMRRSDSSQSKDSPEEDRVGGITPGLSRPPVASFHQPDPPASTQERQPLPSIFAGGASSLRRSSIVRPVAVDFDRELARKHPLKFLVAEDNRLNRKLLVTMLGKLGYTAVCEAFDGAEAVRLMEVNYRGQTLNDHVDVVLMDLWMPNMDGYEATRRILDMERKVSNGVTFGKGIKILAVTADATDGALDRAKEAGMTGFMTKPYKMLDLERLIIEHCAAGA